MDGSKREILGVHFDLVDYETVCETVRHLRERGRREYFVMTNTYSHQLCQRDASFRAATNTAYLTLPDGVGIVMAANLLGIENVGRVTGPSLMLRLCDWGRASGLRHFFLGGERGVAEELASQLSRRYPGLQVAGTFSPSFEDRGPGEDETIMRLVNESSPDLVWIGLGTGKQERWMHEHVGKIVGAAMIGVGAAFDFHSGRKRWAPAWVREAGLEWAFRFLQEPRRMFKKNFSYAAFVFRVLRHFLVVSYDSWRIRRESYSHTLSR